MSLLLGGEKKNKTEWTIEKNKFQKDRRWKLRFIQFFNALIWQEIKMTEDRSTGDNCGRRND